MNCSVEIKRAYDPPLKADGARILVERLWPRGMRKEKLKLDGWLKQAAPSTKLRKWFSHDPDKWQEFKRRYYVELDKHPEAWRPLLDSAKNGRVTLLFSSHDAGHNSAAALRAYLESKRKEH